jgi:hypothetical protein
MLATHHACRPFRVLASHQGLYDRLRSFKFDDGPAQFTFEDRLGARERMVACACAASDR